MRNTLIIILLSFQYLASFAQADRSCVAWSIFERGEYVDFENSEEITYSYQLFSDIENYSFHPEFLQYSYLCKYGFADGAYAINFPEDLKESGTDIVFYDYDNSDTEFNSYYVSCSHNDFGEEDLLIQRTPFANRITVNDLSYANKQIIYAEGKKRNRDFFQDFLQMDVKAICIDQLEVFDEVDGDNMGYLVRDDLVEVLEEQGDWVRVKYLKTDQIYWTYMSCLE